MINYTKSPSATPPGTHAPRGGDPDLEVVGHVRAVLDVVLGVVEAVTPRSIIPTDDRTSPPKIGLSGFRTGTAPCMVLFDMTSAGSRTDQGVVQFSVGLATEVRDVRGALEWTNERNQNSTVGRYYCAVAHHGEHCSIIFEQLIWNGLLLGLWGPGPDWIRDQIGFCVHQALQVSGQHARYLQRTFAASGFPDGHQGLMRLLMTTT